jgi:hypothetical protein
MSTCYCNPDPDYTPAMRLISALTNGYPATVTTTFDHGYVTGTIVRLFIPKPCKMVQANQLSGTITVTGPTTFTIDIDTTNFDVFFKPPDVTVNPHDDTCAQVMPIGEISSITAAAGEWVG